jgi:hypothetical protein
VRGVPCVRGVTTVPVDAPPSPPRPNHPDEERLAEDVPRAAWRRRSPGWILANLLIGFAIGFGLSIANVILVTLLGRDLDIGGEQAETVGATASAMLWLVGVVAWTLAAYLESTARVRWTVFTVAVTVGLSLAAGLTGSAMSHP